MKHTISSLEVAEMVGRDHDNVLKDVRRIVSQLGDVKSYESYFIESSYTNSQNKTQPCYQLTKKGCELYGTRMTGAKGTQFAVKYIERFNEMEQQQFLPFGQQQQLMLTSERVSAIESKLDMVIGQMRIDGVEEQQLKRNGAEKVVQVLGGKKSRAYSQINRKTFKSLWNDFNKHFCIPRYSELPKIKYMDGLDFIQSWKPSTSLQAEIEHYNRQTQLKIK